MVRLLLFGVWTTKFVFEKDGRSAFGPRTDSCLTNVIDTGVGDGLGADSDGIAYLDGAPRGGRPEGSFGAVGGLTCNPVCCFGGSGDDQEKQEEKPQSRKELV